VSTTTTSTRTSARVAGMVGLVLAAVVGLSACDSGSGGVGSSGYSGSGVSTNDPYGVLEESNDDYFDGCQWSQGCGMSPGAWNGNDSNSITGDDDIAPLDDGGAGYGDSSSYGY
jgi:hypothetical protein